MSAWEQSYGSSRESGRGRFGPRKIIGSFAGLFALIVSINILSSVLAAVGAKVCSGAECAPPAVSRPVADNQVWQSWAYGYSLEYPSGSLAVEQQSPDGVELSNESLTLLFSAAKGGSDAVSGALSSEVAALKTNIFDFAPVTQPGEELLGSSVGFMSGRGGAYIGDTSGAQGVTDPLYIAVQAASQDGLTIMATAVIAKQVSATERTAADQLADLVINSIKWPAAASGPASSATEPNGSSAAVGALPRSNPGSAWLGPTAGQRMIAFYLSLALAHERGLARFVAQVNDPRSPLYEHFLSASGFGERYGIPTGRLRAAERALWREGITVTGSYPQRTSLAVRAPAAIVDRVFGVHLEDFRAPDGAIYYAASAPARIPAALAGAVNGVGGLESEPPLRPVRLVRPAVPTGGLTPGDTAVAYGTAPLRRLGIDGQGERIAIVGDGDRFEPSDLIDFDRLYGLPQVLPEIVLVDGGGQLSSEKDVRQEQVREADLDTEVSHAVAPEATLIYFSEPYNDEALIAPAINQIVASHAAEIVSVSYGVCEPDENPGAVQNDDNALLAAAADGISVFVSSGDQGAYGCQGVSPSDHRLAVSYPGSSPYVVSVGGTSLAVGASGGYLGEDAWEDTLSQTGGGGGLSGLFGRPSWQVGPGVQNGYSDGMRQVPDVSADANPATGFATIVEDQANEVGGTSAATPFWAASTALVAQYAAARGHDSLGFVAPLLYQLAASPQPYMPFHSILTGTNRYYPTTPGWNFATGLGSPDVFNLARDVAAYLAKKS